MIAGGVAGGLVFIAIVWAAIAFYRSSTRKIKIHCFENSSVPVIQPSGFAGTTAMHKPPLDTQGQAQHPPPPRQPSRSFPLPRKPPPVISSLEVGVLDQTGGPSITHSRSDPSPDEYSWELEQRASSANSDANPPRRNSARRLASLVSISDGSMRTTGTIDSDGDEAASEADVSERPHGRNQGGEDERATEYLRYTGSGAVRVIELPPSYCDLQLFPA